MTRKWLMIGCSIAFIAGVLCGQYVRQNALTSKTVEYSLTATDSKTNEEVTFSVQRIDQSHFWVTISNGFRYQLTSKKQSNGYLTIILPNDAGKLTLKASLLPWEPAQLYLLTSNRYTKASVSQAKSSDVLDLETLKDSAGRADEEVISKVSLTEDDIEEVISQYGKWLYDSDYAQDSIVVREPYMAFLGQSSQPSLLHFKVDNLSVLGRYSGDQEELTGDLLEDKDRFSTTVLGNNLASHQTEALQSSATFRIYQYQDKHRYFDSQEAEAEEIVSSSSYKQFYQHQVDHKAPSYQIILASNGRVYYAKDFGFKQLSVKGTTYFEAPAELQKEYTALLAKCVSSDK